MRHADQSYSPLYFLAALGAGGISVTFFMFLMFWVPHPGQPVPVFEDIAAAFASGGPLMQAAIAVALAGIATFTGLLVSKLIWNFRALARFQRSPAYDALLKSNAEVTLQAAPLATAMTINGGFIVGLVFVPQLWSVVEYLFPAAIVGFAGVGLWSLMLSARFLRRILAEGGFDEAQNGSFAQMLPAFTLSMVAVGLAAPAAMSTAPVTVAASLVLSTLVGTVAVVYALAVAITALPVMLRQGVNREAAPTLMILIPLMTVLGIMTLRQSHGLHTTFDVHTTGGETLVFLSKLMAVQFASLGLGLVVLRAQGYAQDFIWGEGRSAGAYALVCPAVALSVMGHFWINKGLVAAEVIEKFGAAYWGFTALAVAAQVVAIALVWKLNAGHFRPAAPAAMPAE